MKKTDLGFEEGVAEWCIFLKKAENLSPYFADPSILVDGSGTRISPLTQFEEYVRSWENLREPDEIESYIAAVSKGSAEAPTSSIDYKWGMERPRPYDQMEIAIRDRLESAAYDRNLVRMMYSEIIQWRRPLFIHGGPPRPMLDDRIFSTRLSSGWACWIPEPIVHDDLPMAYSVEELVGGSLIFSNPTPFGWMHEMYGDQIRRMQQVDIALNDLLLLPKIDISEGWSKPYREAFR